MVGLCLDNARLVRLHHMEIVVLGGMLLLWSSEAMCLELPIYVNTCPVLE